ncbi:LPS-assembly lipoprotein [Rhodovulum imhoffii]|uniref:LPS-assembly lipoprotein n=1 Tax=Rhodovulum imhoffii TaxID=365340 RepID=A0A2T5BUW5_9RHOB|nr:LPS assembly lipoprotein LptE [Rhodovulum imhoffii]MBK5934913.1 hypothetical protein [Rhodovulum imhoffii]PTN03314.1 LPS-assembly lipoprotein [Rhodovulum imhoffii]
MSSSDRRTFLSGLAAFVPAGCGFRPLHGTEGAGGDLRGRVAIAPPETRDTFVLNARLEDRLGRGEAAAYSLSYDLSTRRVSLAISRTQDTTRYNIEGALRFALRDLSTGAVVQSGQVQSFTGYSATGTPMAAQVAENDARARLMVILADQLVTRLMAGAAGRAP